jgi:hypothetical protein
MAGWLWIIGAVVLWWLLLKRDRRRIRKYDGTGDLNAGIVLFVEPVRWLFVIWGFADFCKGLRLAGWQGKVELILWSSHIGALLVFPDLMRPGRQQRFAEKLAAHIDKLAQKHPGSPIHLVGYSGGSYVVLEAIRRISYPEALDQVILLGAAISPRYPLDSLSDRIRSLSSFHSAIDLITGIGPAIFGCCDRRWCPAAGTLGFKNPPAFVTEHRWRLRDLSLGYLGDHFTITAPRFVADRIAPILQQSNEPKDRQ